ncbi:hypothetical protein [Paenibacillus ihumii]|uniref:hypothetical protein n=1 Tax=Paenibacillus ihumii TaxID=687436 RepID=UPI001CA33318|nr:hypothetical protein [Paenibacillus ihumii]
MKFAIYARRKGGGESMLGHIHLLKTNVSSDAGYENEENYAYLEGQSVKAIIKYNTCHKKKQKLEKRK